jgi:6-phosphogluconolactonase
MTTPSTLRAADLPALQVLPTADAVASAAAETIARILTDAVAARGVAHWATTGGSSAPPIYRRLGAEPLRSRVTWEQVHTWWGDDRFVPSDHPLSNVMPLEQVLLDSGGDEAASGATGADVEGSGSGVRMPSANLHPIPMSAALAAAGGVAWAASAYEMELRDVGPETNAAGDPMFDLIVLGVGPDGHVLSVFPGSPAWDAPGLCVGIAAPTHVEPHVARVTLHPRLLAAARSILVVSTGAAKASVLGRAWSGDDLRELPLRAARTGHATWILDEAAASELPRG